MPTRIGQLLAFFFVWSLLPAQNDTVRLHLATRTATAVNQTVCLPLTAERFNGVLSAQFSLTWNTDRLQFSSLEIGENPLGLSTGQYNVAADTAVGVSWTSADGNPVSVPQGSVLFELCFINKADTGFSPVTFEGWLEPEFAVGPPIELAKYEIAPGGVQITAAPTFPIYPGDTNADSVVNYLDILPIGLAFAETGPIRTGASVAFNEQQAPEWLQTLPVSQVNYRHIDADGNGSIGSSDASTVAANYGAVINPLWETLPDPAYPRTQVPHLYVVADTVPGGQTAVLDILLEDSNIPIEVYGLGFRIAYDPELVIAGSIDVDFTGSFFAGDGATLLTLDRDLSAAGEVHIALTRRNRSNYAGFGRVARISFQTRSVPQGSFAELPLTISGIRLVTADEFPITVAGQTSIIGIEGTTATQEPAWSKELLLYPNPFRDGMPLRILAPAGKISTVRLLSATGRLLRQSASTDQLNLDDLAAGIYLLRLAGPEGTLTRKVIKY